MDGPSIPPRREVTETDTDSDPGEVLAPAAPRVGLEGRLGRYLLLEQVGSGGSGLVCRAYDPELDRQVAIKVLNRAGPTKARAARRLKREAQAIAQLDHPNVIDVYDVGEHDHEVFIATEYVDAGSLKAWLAEPRPLEAILNAFIQAGRGLAAAHAKGIIHRDFKPSNVLVGADGVVRVADFGLARGVGDAPDDPDSVSSTSPPFDQDAGRPATIDRGPVPRSEDSASGGHEGVTVSGAVLGTPAYMAPEQFHASAVDARADQYAFCLALGEALAGVQGREAVAEAFGPQPSAAVAPRVDRIPRPIRAAVRRGLSERPEDRFATIDAVVAILEAPRQRRRWSQRAVVALALTAAVAAAGGYHLERTRSLCADLGAPFRKIWSPDRAAALARRFVAAGGSSAGWEEVLRGIERYRRRWTAAREDVCEATHYRKVQSERLLDLRMGCLDEGLDGMRAVLDLLQNEPRVDTQAASEAVLRLPSVDACRSVTAPLRRQPQPQTAAEQAALSAVTRGLKVLAAMHGAGLWESGLARSEPLLRRAEDLGFDLPLADVRAWHARFLAANDRVAEAKAHWQKVALHADAARADERRLVAYLARIELDDGGIDTRIEVDNYVAMARALMARLDRSQAHEAAWLTALARLAYRRGQLSECRARAAEALDRLASRRGARLVDRLDVAELLGSCLERLGLRREAARILEEALAQAMARLGERHPRVAQLWWRLSRARDFAGDRAGARAAAERALEISLATLGPEHSMTGRGWHALSNVASREGRYEEALAHNQRAIAIYRKVHGPRSRWVCSMLTNRGLILARLGRRAAAYAAHEQAIALYTDVLGPEHVETGAAIGRLGAAYADFEEYDKAVATYRRALHILRTTDPMHARVLDQVRGLIISLLALGRPRDALEYVEMGLAVSAKRDETPYFTARLEFLAARALWQSHADRGRARGLAESAAARLEAEGHHPDAAREVRTWLESKRN